MDDKNWTKNGTSTDFSLDQNQIQTGCNLNQNRTITEKNWTKTGTELDQKKEYNWIIIGLNLDPTWTKTGLYLDQGWTKKINWNSI